MNWYRNLYCGKTAKKRSYELMRLVEEGKNPLFLLLIALPSSLDNQLEILSPQQYRRQAKQTGEPLIVGMAYGMQEARQVVTELVGEIVRRTGAAEVRAYFEEREADGWTAAADTSGRGSFRAAVGSRTE